MATRQMVASTSSDLTRELTSSVINSNGTITQTERLFSMRPRYNTQGSKLGGNRGTRAYIRLMTTQKTISAGRGQSTEGISPKAENMKSVLDNAIYGSEEQQNSGAMGYANFLLTDVNCTFSEKAQISQVFGDGEVVYYFGRDPIQMTFSGTLIDSPDNNWFVQWIEMYGQVMRGTQLARNYELLKIVLPNMEVVGSIMNTSFSQNSQNDSIINFQFTFLAKQVQPISVIVSGRPASEEVALIDFAQADKFLDQAQINSIKKSTAGYIDAIKNPFSTVTDIANGLTGLKNSISGGWYDGNHGAPMTGSDSFGFGSNSTASNYSDSFGSFGDLVGGMATSVSDVFNTVGSALNGIRAALFTPIYGVLSSLTKLIRNVGGTIKSIFDSIANPIKNILRDIQNISSQAIGLVRMIENTIGGITNQIRNIDSIARETIVGMKKAVGTITAAPTTISMSLRQMVNAGAMPRTTGYLRNRNEVRLQNSTKPGGGGGASLGGGGLTNSKLAMLNSGPKHTPEQGAFL